METIKSFTSLEQSKKLAEILPLESADMWWTWFSNPLDDVNGGEYDKEPLLHEPVCSPEKAIPCWSLAALLQIMPHCIENIYWLTLGKLAGNSGWYICYEEIDIDQSQAYYIANRNLLDACYEMIIKLNGEKLL